MLYAKNVGADAGDPPMSLAPPRRHRGQGCCAVAADGSGWGSRRTGVGGCVVGTIDAGENWLDLADAIALIRKQIGEARNRLAVAGDAGVPLTLGEITLELGMELTRVQGVNGGLRFSVASFEGNRGTTRTATHTVTVRLQPHGPQGLDGVNVNDLE